MKRILICRFFMRVVMYGALLGTYVFGQELRNHSFMPALIYGDNTSAEGIPGMSYVHMHNKKGIRVEYNLHTQRLTLWVSPLAGKSLHHSDRNFSNRDDHTSIFDFIGFPQLKYERLVKVEYDPQHTTILYKNNALHIMPLMHKPAVVVWLDSAATVDIKTDKQDRVPVREPELMLSKHRERGKVFDFLAAVSPSLGTLVHQKVISEGRSTYASVELKPGGFLILAGEVAMETPRKQVVELSKKKLSDLIWQNDSLAKAETRPGTIKVRNHPQLQKIIDVNKRILYSMQDESGAMRAALRHIYYLIWHRDGGMVHSYNAYLGWTAPLKNWIDFVLANPTKNEKGELYFGQLVSPISKLEEDGSFYGVWSAFTYVTQTGDTSYLKPKQLDVLDKTIQWLENNYYDRSKGLFYRYHYCESPYYQGPGYGWDDAVGKRNAGERAYTWKGDTVLSAYDVYINNLMYASYWMMAYLHKSPDKKNPYEIKAKELGLNIRTRLLSTEEGLPAYGVLRMNNTKEVVAEGPGPDETDYQWAFGLPLFHVDYQKVEKIKAVLSEQHMKKPSGQFLSGLFSNIVCLDPELHNPESMKTTILYVVPQITTSGVCLPMAYSVPEIVDVQDCNVYHDVRPQPFSISAYLAAISNLGLRRLPFGIAVRGTDFLDSIADYQYKQARIQLAYKGSGNYVKEVKVNGKSIKRCLQIPEAMLRKGTNRIDVAATIAPYKVATWIGSSLHVQELTPKGLKAVAYGHNVIMIKNANSKIVVTQKGNPLVTSTYKVQDVTYAEFEGKGEVDVQY